jgi:site-specific recombinase XerD
MTPRAIRVLRDRKAAFPEAANSRVKSVRQVFAWAIDHDHVTSNPAREVRYLRGRVEGFHTWSVDEVEKFEEHHPIGISCALSTRALDVHGRATL